MQFAIQERRGLGTGLQGDGQTRLHELTTGHPRFIDGEVAHVLKRPAQEAYANVSRKPGRPREEDEVRVREDAARWQDLRARRRRPRGSPGR